MSRFRKLALAAALTLAASTSAAGIARADQYWDRYHNGYDRGWWGQADDHHGDWKDRRYQRREANDRPGDAQRFNDRLCHNGIPGDAPAGCD